MQVRENIRHQKYVSMNLKALYCIYAFTYFHIVSMDLLPSCYSKKNRKELLNDKIKKKENRQ